MPGETQGQKLAVQICISETLIGLSVWEDDTFIKTVRTILKETDDVQIPPRVLIMGVGKMSEVLCHVLGVSVQE